MDNVLFPGIDSNPENMTREELIDLFNRLKVLAAKYKSSEEALRLDEARLEALLKLNDMAMVAEDDIIAYSLEEAIRLTGSRIGWMGALSPDEKTLTMHCWSKRTKEECGILGQPHALSVGDGGIWMEPILQRKPVIVNDYEGYHRKSIPYGHIPVRRFMGVPVYDGTRIVAVAEVGNKVSIEDNGPGIPDTWKDEIFDRLSQGKMRALRTGLGLGLVKTLVESYSGLIWVEDRIEGDHSRGCRFVVVLPDARQTHAMRLEKSCS